MSVRGKPVLWIAFSLATLTASVASSQPPDLTYHTVPTCVVVYTPITGGKFAANETRTYNVVGAGSFASQGGSSTGCGVPGFSNGIAEVVAVELNVAASLTEGAGHLKVDRSDSPADRTMVSFPAGGATIADTGAVAVSQTDGVGDIRIQATAVTHVIVKVVGYYTRAVQTVYVHPVPGDHTASGTRLINALAGITNASATKRYVVKVEPGIYDVGSTMLEMKPYVDIEGSGQEATVIKGNGNSTSNMTAIVEGADSAELRNLQVKSVGASPQVYSVGIALDDADTTIRNVTVRSSGAVANWGIRMIYSNPVIEEVNIEVTGAGANYGLVTGASAEAIVRRSVIKVEGIGTSGTKTGIYMEYNGFPKELSDVEIVVKGGTTGIGIAVDSSTAQPTITIRSSQIAVSDSSIATYGIKNGNTAGFEIFSSRIEASGSSSTGFDANFGVVRVMNSTVSGETYTVVSAFAEIGATFLNGGPAYGTCAGVYDESFTFYASTCP